MNKEMRKRFKAIWNPLDPDVRRRDENIINFIQQEIDLAVAERDKEIVEMIEVLIKTNTKGNPLPTIEQSVAEEIINLIKNDHTN